MRSQSCSRNSIRNEYGVRPRKLEFVKDVTDGQVGLHDKDLDQTELLLRKLDPGFSREPHVTEL